MFQAALNQLIAVPPTVVRIAFDNEDRLCVLKEFCYDQIRKLHIPNATIRDAETQCLCGCEGVDSDGLF